MAVAYWSLVKAHRAAANCEIVPCRTGARFVFGVQFISVCLSVRGEKMAKRNSTIFMLAPTHSADAPGLTFSGGLFGVFAGDRRFAHIG
jgi:hypothetical protein